MNLQSKTAKTPSFTNSKLTINDYWDSKGSAILGANSVYDKIKECDCIVEHESEHEDCVKIKNKDKKWNKTIKEMPA